MLRKKFNPYTISQLVTYLAVFNSTSITKSILGDVMLASANALMIEHFNLISFGGRF